MCFPDREAATTPARAPIPRRVPQILPVTVPRPAAALVPVQEAAVMLAEAIKAHKRFFDEFMKVKMFAITSATIVMSNPMVTYNQDL